MRNHLRQESKWISKRSEEKKWTNEEYYASMEAGRGELGQESNGWRGKRGRGGWKKGCERRQTFAKKGLQKTERTRKERAMGGELDIPKGKHLKVSPCCERAEPRGRLLS